MVEVRYLPATTAKHTAAMNIVVVDRVMIFYIYTKENVIKRERSIKQGSLDELAATK